jgi:ABC-type amino acid transport substrate-binding protein
MPTVKMPWQNGRSAMYGKRFLGYLVAALAVFSATCAGATLDRLRQDGTIRIAYRRDAPPFSYQNGDAKPAGFIVDLCDAVTKRLSQQLNLPSLKISYVPVTASDRFDAIQQGKADLLCEATSVTLSRRKMMDFSVDTFVDGASLITTVTSLTSLKAMAGQKIGVLAGTTTEQALRNTLAAEGINATVVLVPTHNEGLTMLDGGQLSAYFADRTILWVLQASSKAPDKLLLADQYLTVEPYALGLPKGDDDFRNEVDRALAEIYRSGEIVPILTHTFGDKFQLSPMLQTLYLISAIPD